MQQALSIAPTLMLLAGIAAAVEMLMKRSSRVSEQAALDLAHALNRLASKEQTTAEGRDQPSTHIERGRQLKLEIDAQPDDV